MRKAEKWRIETDKIRCQDFSRAFIWHTFEDQTVLLDKKSQVLIMHSIS